jgi:hypothetical protein
LIVEQPAVYRVSFEGTELTDAAREALTAAGAPWEGSVCGPEGPNRHRALARAASERDAIAAVRTALAAYVAFGAYIDFTAAPIRDFRGALWTGPFYRQWDEIDWQADPRRARLTKREREVLSCLLNAAEPTWIVVSDPNVQLDRARAEAVLSELEKRSLVYSVLGTGGEPGRASELDRWWAVTDECWDILGMIKSPTYW